MVSDAFKVGYGLYETFVGYIIQPADSDFYREHRKDSLYAVGTSNGTNEEGGWN